MSAQSLCHTVVRIVDWNSDTLLELACYRLPFQPHVAIPDLRIHYVQPLYFLHQKKKWKQRKVQHIFCCWVTWPEHPWNHNRVIIARPGWMCCIQGLIFYRMPCTFWLDFSFVSSVGVSMLYLPPVSLQFAVSCISCISSNMHFLSHVIVHLPSCVLLACQRRLCTITGVSGTH